MPTGLERRLLEVLQARGICTLRRAGYHAILSRRDVVRAARGLQAEGLLEAEDNGRLIPISSGSSDAILLRLTAAALAPAEPETEGEA